MVASTTRPGRPRSQTSRDAILKAAFAVLAERGYAGMTFEAVAARASAGKTTIYRWWPSKTELAVTAFLHGTHDELAIPRSGSAREDFRRQISELADLLCGPRGVVFAAMLGGARTEPELARALGERWLEPRRTWGITRMKEAVASGECHPGIDVRAALGILYAPLYAPLLFGQDAPSSAEVAAHLAIALPAVFVTKS